MEEDCTEVMPGDKDCVSAPMGMSPRSSRHSRERNKELLALADTIAVLVEAQTKRSERCRLRRMVELLLDHNE